MTARLTAARPATSEFDLIVIGGGSGGLAGAFRAAEHGARVALLEPHLLGGTCVNVGCVPKKAMWLAAEMASTLKLAPMLGFALQPAALNWPEFIVHRERYIEGIHASYRRRLDAAGIVLAPMRAHLIDARTVECENGTRLRAHHLLIATGGRPERPDIPGAELGVVSDNFFQWRAAPERVAIVGGGYIAVELAGVLQALGSRVEMYVRGPHLLRGFDHDVVAQLTEEYRQSGVRLCFEQRLVAVEADSGGVRLRGADGTASDRFDQVLFATGRRPNSERMGLEAVGVATDAQGHVVVNARHETSVEGVYAVGDITANAQLTPVAIAAARHLMDRVFGGSQAILDQRDIPTVVFSHPPMGQVGLTESQARVEHGETAVHVYRAAFRPMLHALADMPQRSVFKLVCVGDERRVVGIHLLGEAADEILQGFAVALKRGITLQDLRDTVAIHPTSAEEVVLMR